MERPFARMGIFECFISEPLPIQTWIGVAQAMADASGLRVTVESHELEPSQNNHEQKIGRGFCKVAVLDPTIFVRPAWRR